jgi:hypothetical protein
LDNGSANRNIISIELATASHLLDFSSLYIWIAFSHTKEGFDGSTRTDYGKDVGSRLNWSTATEEEAWTVGGLVGESGGMGWATLVEVDIGPRECWLCVCFCWSETRGVAFVRLPLPLVLFPLRFPYICPTVLQHEPFVHICLVQVHIALPTQSTPLAWHDMT